MPLRLQEELRQSRPFDCPAEEATVALLRTVALLERLMVQTLRPYSLTKSQFNLLRILRGAGPEGLASGQISERMVSLDPDVTRLLDRLEKRSLITRRRTEGDRRIITVTITQAGLDLLVKIGELLVELNIQTFQDFPENQVHDLIDLLARLREKINVLIIQMDPPA
jgi:DNA-binding MarR family transcriptional regulator